MNGALILVTCGSNEEAVSVARSLVGLRHAAGVQIVPIESVYRWQGEVVEDEEWLLIIKTQPELYEKVEATVRRVHSYDVPPLVMLKMDRAGSDYLHWITEET